jgi:lysophospholipase L1-like esterase
VRLQSWFARIGLALVSVLLVLALAELFARRVWQPPPKPAPRVELLSKPGMPTLRGLRALSKPNAMGVYAGVVHQTNDQGIRGRNRKRQGRRRVVRIGVGGDSFTMGQGVAETDTYVARLERTLDAEGSSVGFEVLNFGLSGLGARTAIGRLVQFSDYYSVDVVVYGFTINDIAGPNYITRVDPERQKDRFYRAIRLKSSGSHLVRMVGPGLAMLFDRLAGNPGSQIEEVEFNYFDNPAAAKNFEESLDRFAELVRSRNGCGLVLMHTALDELGWLHPWGRVGDHVESLVTERGVIAVQTYPAHAGMHETPLWVHATDAHPNAEGHRILANVPRAGRDLLPAHCLEARRGRSAGVDR